MSGICSDSCRAITLHAERDASSIQSIRGIVGTVEAVGLVSESGATMRRSGGNFASTMGCAACLSAANRGSSSTVTTKGGGSAGAAPRCRKSSDNSKTPAPMCPTQATISIKERTRRLLGTLFPEHIPFGVFRHTGRTGMMPHL